MKKLSVLAALIAALLFTGCMSAHVKPGSIVTPSVTQTQPFNPKGSTELETESYRELDFVAPAGTVIVQGDTRVTIPTNTPVRIVSTDKVDSKLGAADISIGKMIAKLKSVRWIQGVGVLVFLFGAASFAYPPLRAIIGSVTTSVMISAAGVALIVLPILVVGNEILILIGCLGAAAAYFFIHRYGKKSGEVETLKKWVDLNGNGKVDPGEMIDK